MAKDLKARQRDLMRAALNRLEISGTSGLAQKGEIRFTSDNTAEVVFTGIKDGQQTVTATYKGGEPKSTTVIVRPLPAKLQTVNPETFEKIVGEEQIIELGFDKALIQGQGYPIVDVTENLDYTTPFMINSDRTGGTIGVTGNNPGDGTVNINLGGVIIVSKATIKEVPAQLLTVTAQPEVFNVDDIVEIIAEHDKTPLIENVQFTPSAGLEEVEAPHIQGSTVRAKYKGIATGTQRVDVTSFRISKSVTMQVNPKPIIYPVLQRVTITPERALIGKNVNIEILFDKVEHLFLSDISVLVPEGVSEVSRLTINQDTNTATGTYKVEQEGTKEWSVTYKDVTKTATVEVVPLAVVKLFECENTTVYVGDEIVVNGTFDKAIEEGQADPELTVDEGLQIKVPFTVNLEKTGGTATLLATASIATALGKLRLGSSALHEETQFGSKASLSLGGVTKEINFKVLPKQATLTQITTSAAEVRKNTDFIATYVYDKAPILSDTEFSNSEGLTLTVPHKVVGNTIVATYNSGEIAGGAWIKAVCGKETKELTITVLDDAVIKTAAAAKDNIEIGEEVAINVEFDKAFVEGQDLLRAEYSEGIAESAAFLMNPERTNGVLKVTPSASGVQTVTLHLGGASKRVQINVLPKVQPTGIEANPLSINIGETSTVTVTFNRAITDASLVTVQLPAGLTGPSELTLIEAGTKGTLAVVGKASGVQAVTISANGQTRTIEITVQADPKLASVKVTPDTGYPTETEYTVTGEFDKAPNLDDVTIEAQEGLTESVAKELSGNNVVVKYKSTTAGNKVVTFKYKDQTKEATIVCVAKPATLVDMQADKTEFLDKEPGDVKLTLTFEGAEPTLDSLHITAPETYFGVKTQAAVSGNTITATYTTKDVVKADAKITAEYLGVTKEVTIKITQASTVDALTIDSMQAQPGDDITVKCTFSAALPAIQTAPEIVATTDGLTKKGELTVDESRTFVTQKFTINPGVTTAQTVRVTMFGQNTDKSITPVAKAVLKTVTPAPASVAIGAKSVVTIAFDKAPRLNEVQITADTDKLTESKAKAISGKNVTVEYTGKAQGTANISVVHNGVTKQASIEVTGGAGA